MLNTDITNKITDFSIRLFKEIARGGNVLISPVSLLAPLLMLQIGAAGETLKQIEAVTQMEPEATLQYLKNVFADDGIDGKLNFANALFINNDGNVVFNDEYFSLIESLGNAELLREAFSSMTCEKINRWAREKTEGAIPEIISKMPDDIAITILNALYFNKKWAKTYATKDVRKHLFTDKDGKETEVDFMFGTETSYFKNDMAHGFSKAYSGGRYEFVAMLPGKYDADRNSLVEWLSKRDVEKQAEIIESLKQSNKDVDYDYLLSDEYIKAPELHSFIDSLTAEGLRELMSNKKNISVKTAIPKFETSNKLLLATALQSMGVSDAFNVETADFSGIGKATDVDYNLCIGDVQQKALIKVDEKGTVAAAVTMLGLKCLYSCSMPEYRIYLDRPFIYMIWDNEADIPLFMGAVDHLN